MKKIFILAYLLGVISYVGYSQSLSLSDDSGPVANNTTVTVVGLPTDDEIIVEMYVTNNTTDSIPVICKKVELYMVPGSASLFCWGLCFGPGVFESPDPIYIHAGETNQTDFSGHYLPQTYPGLSTIRYVFFDERNPLDSVCFNVNFQAYPLGIQDPVSLSAIYAYPNPANSKVTIEYSARGFNEGSLVIRNLVGETVKEVAVSGASGTATFQLDGLVPGIYFYSLVVDGKTLATKKLIVS